MQDRTIARWDQTTSEVPEGLPGIALRGDPRLLEEQVTIALSRAFFTEVKGDRRPSPAPLSLHARISHVIDSHMPYSIGATSTESPS